MDSKLNGIGFDTYDERNHRIEVADMFMSIQDEDGQPMFDVDWVKRNIIGDFEETKKPE